MPRVRIAINAWLLVSVLCTVGEAQSHDVPLPVEELQCSLCHTCDKPTERYPCLRVCPRTSAAAIKKELSQKRVPDLVIMDELEELYLPVPFDHRGHAEMAEMIEGCAVCHHHTPEGAALPACKSCHETSPKREDIRKPSLKAAYHRQCMGCHRDWSGATRCAACHPPKIGQEQGESTVEGLLSKMHPPIPAPDTEIYQLRSDPSPGTRVIFRHKEHIDRFGLKCAHCHQEDTCSRCHSEREEDGQSEKTLAEHHAPCSRCHDVQNKDACDHCHWKEGEPRPEPFVHASTGWPLNRNHAVLACRTCHEDVPFRKLDRDCDTCHSDWSPSSFDHAVTGQVLDENHAEAGCADCHADRKFSQAPRCDECHDEEEGIVFPGKRPGPIATIPQTTNPE